MPGKSGNPAGRAKIVKDVQDLCRKHTKEAIETLVELMRTGSDKVRVVAANALLDRAYGKPAQSVNLGGSDGQPLKLYIGVSPNEWEASTS